MYDSKIGNINDYFGDIKYMLAMVRSRRYHYDLELASKIYNSILQSLIGILEYIEKTNPNELYIVRNEMDNLDIVLDILELIVASPIQNVVVYDKLGMVQNVTKLIANIDKINPEEKQYIDSRLNTLYNWKLWDNKLKRDFCVLFIASVYMSEDLNCYDAYILIYNATLDKIFKDFYIDIPAMNIREMRGNFNAENIINEIWFLASQHQWNPRNPKNHKKFYEFGAFDLWNNYQAHLMDFYDGLASVVMEIIDEVMRMIGPTISNILIAYIKIKMALFEDYVYSEYGANPSLGEIEIRTV